MKKNSILLVAMLGTLYCHAQINASPDSTDIKISEKINASFSKNVVPGMFVAVNNKGKYSYYSKGYADTDQKKGFDSATIFEIGSVTKTFTAYVLQKLLNENKIADTSSIIDFLPDSLRQNSALAGINFRSLLNHTSGLPRLPENMEVTEGNLTPYNNYGAADLFTYLKSCTPAPDGKSTYSNLGMGLAGVLAERIAKRTYAELLEQHIFRPFKMIASTEEFSTDGNKSQGYFDDEKAPYWNMNVMAPAGGLKCNGMEMLTYLHTMSKPPDAGMAAIIDELLKPTATVNAKISVGKAWHLFTTKENTTVYWHNGGTYGFSTFAAFLKGEDKGVMIVINQFNKNQVSDALGMAIMKLLSQ